MFYNEYTRLSEKLLPSRALSFSFVSGNNYWIFYHQFYIGLSLRGVWHSICLRRCRIIAGEEMVWRDVQDFVSKTLLPRGLDISSPRRAVVKASGVSPKYLRPFQWLLRRFHFPSFPFRNRLFVVLLTTLHLSWACNIFNFVSTFCRFSVMVILICSIFLECITHICVKYILFISLVWRFKTMFCNLNSIFAGLCFHVV